MGQKDFVTRGCITARRKTNKEKAKKAQRLRIMIFILVAIFLLFLGVLFYMTENEKKALKNERAYHPVTLVKKLPPKPEERWRYIKELGRRGVDSPNIRQSNLLLKERKRLEQIDSSKQKPVMNLQEMPYNTHSVLRSEIISEPTKIVSPSILKKSTVPVDIKSEKPIEKSFLSEEFAQKNNQDDNNLATILMQCGFFQTTAQVESIRAKLAFSGIESRVTSRGGLHSIIAGPYPNSTAEKIRDHVNSIGVSGCILHSSES